MVDKKCNVSIKDYFRPKNEKKWLQDPTSDFSVVPSWSKEFACLVGLEEVVQFRLERLDKAVYTASNKRTTRGRPKKFPVPAVVPPTLPKDPNTCAKCSTDVSCSWKHDVNSSLLCYSCFKYSWRKAHWLSIVPTETIIKSISNNSSILTSPSQPVRNELKFMKEAVFPLQPSSQTIPQECDQQVPKNSLSSSSNCHPDSPFYSSSPLSSDLSSSPPGYYSDASSHWSSSFSSDHPCSCIYCSSSSCGSSLCDSSSPQYLPSSLDLSSSSSKTPSPSGPPPNNSRKWVSQKVKTPYWMEKEEQSRRIKSQSKEEKTGNMAALSVPTSSSNEQILLKPQSALLDSEPSTSPLLIVGEHQFQTLTLTPNLQKTTIAEKSKLTLNEGSKPAGHGNLQKITLNVSSDYFSCSASGSSTYTSDSGKSKSTVGRLPTTWSAVSGNIRQQDSRSIPRCSQESNMKNEKFGTNVRHQASHAHPSSSLMSSAPTDTSFSSQTVLSTNLGKTKPQEKVKWGATLSQKIDKWIQKPETSMGSHGSYPSCSSSSSSSSSSASFGQPENVNQ